MSTPAKKTARRTPRRAPARPTAGQFYAVMVYRLSIAVLITIVILHIGGK